MDHKEPISLDALEIQHRQEEQQEAQRDLLETPRPLQALFPAQGSLPQSDHWLARFYEGDRIAREKKPGVYDHLRSVGPWFVSVDDAPMSVIDGMSQTATVCAGFAEDAVVSAYAEGSFGQSALRCPDSAAGETPEVESFASFLRGQLPEFAHVTFTNSGAEANEKALALCRPHARNPKARRVLSFEGSFHGRALLALFGTWNPVKRAPFELPGYEGCFAPFPVWSAPMAREPEESKAFRALVADGRLEELRRDFGGQDDLLDAEIASLEKVHEILGAGECFACWIEPMQSEGGDRYATSRFFRALRLLTRHHGIPLILDEVQTGFGLGGPFFWHTRFGFVDRDGNPDTPDVVTVAKRAQVGVCMSRFPDPEPTSAHTASLVRGLVHAQMMAVSQGASRVEALIWPRLQDIARRYPQFVALPRVCGYAFAFDMPTASLRNNLIAHRFWRGVIVFGAGSRTVRYRLSDAFDEALLDQVFAAIRRSLSWLDAHPGQTPPTWEDFPAAESVQERREVPVTLRVAAGTERDEVVSQIRALEARVFEPARRDSVESLQLAFDAQDGVAIVAELEEDGARRLVGYAVAAPLEAVAQVSGPDIDPMQGKNNTLYSIAISVDPAFHRLGLGRKLKNAQIARAREMQSDQGPRYTFIAGRNRVGMADSMMRLNRSLGAHVHKVLTQQYNDPDGKAYYYRIPVRGLVPLCAPQNTGAPKLDASGLSAPLAQPPETLLALEQSGQLSGPAVSKVTICNYITPAVSRSVEWVGALVPDLPHMYLTSGRDETIDKAVRTLRYQRKEAELVLGWKGGYVGHTTAAARSVSDPSLHNQGEPIFEWPLLSHPADVGSEAAAKALEEAIAQAGGGKKILGIFIELVQERTGKTIPADFWPLVARIRRTTGVPLIFVETASSFYRSGRGAFASSHLSVRPDLLLWWGGGQQGYVHMTRPWFISKPLMMVSTWDGDELSMIRIHHQLQKARKLSLKPAIEALQTLLDTASQKGLVSHGLGLYRVMEAGDSADKIEAALVQEGVKARRYPGGRLALSPCLDEAANVVEALQRALVSTGYLA